MDIYKILQSALEKVQTDVVDKFIKCYCFADEIVCSFLHIAVWKGWTEICKLLLSNGANVNAEGHSGETPLHNAVGRTNAAVVTLLLCHGANVNATDKYGKTPLHYAARYSCTEIAKMLISKGAEVNARDGRGVTPLHDTVFSKKAGIVSLLLNYDIKARTYTDEMTPVLKGCAEIADLLLLKGANVNARNESWETPLHRAVQYGNVAVVKLLLKYDADVNARNESWETPLHRAVQYGNVAVVKLLLKYDADVNASMGMGILGWTPVHVASSKNLAEIVELLLSKGAEVNSKSWSDGSTALHYAAGNGDYTLVKLLLSHGADISSLDFKRRTPLFSACTWENGDSLCALLEHGTAINFKANTGKTPLHVAAYYSKDKNVVLSLLKHGAVTHLQDDTGKSALHYAVTNWSNSSSVIFALLENGANVDCKDKTGRTALHVASETGHAEGVRALLSYGADVNVFADSKLTALNCANKNLNRFADLWDQNCSCRKEVIDILVKHIVSQSTLDFPLHKMNLDSINWFSADVQLFQHECTNELARLKQVYIENTDVTISIYDILKRNKRAWLRFLQKRMWSDVSDILQPHLYNSPIFQNIITHNFRALEREFLLRDSTFLLSQIFLNLPDNCLKAITECLNNGDLKKFIKGCRPTYLIKKR